MSYLEYYICGLSAIPLGNTFVILPYNTKIHPRIVMDNHLLKTGMIQITE
jgi:hypothetical protein